MDETTTKMLKRSCFQFAKKLVDGVLAKKETLDEQILLAAKNWRLERMGRLDLNLMRIAAFELLNIPEPPATPTPPATAINEAIELSKVFCQADSRRFVNGVLDQLRKNNNVERKAKESVPSSEDAQAETDAGETQPPEDKTEG
jgi:transcription antitermination factor NusB